MVASTWYVYSFVCLVVVGRSVARLIVRSIELFAPLLCAHACIERKRILLLSEIVKHAVIMEKEILKYFVTLPPEGFQWKRIFPKHPHFIHFFTSIIQKKDILPRKRSIRMRPREEPASLHDGQ